jgi:peptide/nickel transport system permease protein
MGKYILKRLVHLVWILIAVSFLTFLLLYLAPGDAATKKLNAQGVAVSQEVLERTREEMGLNRPFFVQFGDWAIHALRGDLGQSYKDGTAVSGKLSAGLRRTVLLALSSLVLALIIALPLSILTAIRKDGVLDYAVRFLSFIGNSMPNFLISVLLMYWFCVKLRLLPVVAEESFKGLLLPALALSIPMCGRFLRQFRAEVLEQLGRPYVAGARARGVTAGKILFFNVLRGALLPILTIVGLSIGTLMGGSVVIETVFRWPGLGKVAMDAISARDIPVVQGFVLLTAVIYTLVNLLTDLAYHWVDPRVRQE